MLKILIIIATALMQSCTSAKAEFSPGNVGTVATFPSGLPIFAFHATQPVAQQVIANSAETILSDLNDSTSPGFDSSNVMGPTSFTAKGDGVYSFQTCVRLDGNNLIEGEYLILGLGTESGLLTKSKHYPSANVQDYSSCHAATLYLRNNQVVRVLMYTNSGNNLVTDETSIHFSGLKVN